MSITLLYVISLILPMIIVPAVSPAVILMSGRKHLTDKPSARKLQSFPVAVMGGTVIMIAVAATSVIVNLFYDISSLFPVMCVMFILYIMGMLDDTLSLNWQLKMAVMIISVLLLYFGGDYGVENLYYMLFGAEPPEWLAVILTVLVGLLLLNAANFADGVDGLATGLGAMTGVVMGCWNLFHGFVVQTLISFVMTGSFLMFFVFNVFSDKYKMYLGDSGSLLVGLFVYASACPNSFAMVYGNYLVDRYFVSFIVALCSAMTFDLVRVVITRLIRHHSPFLPDRNHLHHVLVDLGFSHLMTTIIILTMNCMVLAVWLLTAYFGMNVKWQFVVVVSTCVILYWGLYMIVVWFRDNDRNRYSAMQKRIVRRGRWFNKFVEIIGRLIDGRRIPNGK